MCYKKFRKLYKYRYYSAFLEIFHEIFPNSKRTNDKNINMTFDSILCITFILFWCCNNENNTNITNTVSQKFFKLKENLLGIVQNILIKSKTMHNFIYFDIAQLRNTDTLTQTRTDRYFILT